MEASRTKKAQAEADLEERERRQKELQKKLESSLTDLERAEIEKYAQTFTSSGDGSGERGAQQEGEATNDDLDIDDDVRELLEGQEEHVDGADGMNAREGAERALKWPCDALKNIPPDVSVKLITDANSCEDDVEISDDGVEVLAGAAVTVQYTLTRRECAVGTSKADLWEDDDALCLEAVAAPRAFALHTGMSPSSSSSSSLSVASSGSSPWLYKENEQPFEVIEYTDTPTALSVRAPTTNPKETLRGRTSLTLPTYGGWYVVTYVRTVTEIIQQAERKGREEKGDDNPDRRSATAQSRISVVRRRVELGRSHPFQVLAPLLGSHPDIRCGAVASIRRRGTGHMYDSASNTKKAESKSSSSLAKQKLSSETVSSTYVDRQLRLVVEDQRNIRTLSITGSVKDASGPTTTTATSTVESYCLSRVMAWAFFEAASGGSPDASSAYGLRIVVETDIISLERSDRGSLQDPASLSATSSRTAYASVIISDIDIVSSLSGLSVNTDTPKNGIILPLDLRKIDANIEIEPFGRFVCRIPYPSHQKTSTRNGQKRNLVDLWGNGPLSISCGFCCADITKEGELQTARVLPTGIFDDVSRTRTHTQHCCLS